MEDSMIDNVLINMGDIFDNNTFPVLVSNTEMKDFLNNNIEGVKVDKWKLMDSLSFDIDVYYIRGKEFCDKLLEDYILENQDKLGAVDHEIQRYYKAITERFGEEGVLLYTSDAAMLFNDLDDVGKSEMLHHLAKGFHKDGVVFMNAVLSFTDPYFKTIRRDWNNFSYLVKHYRGTEFGNIFKYKHDRSYDYINREELYRSVKLMSYFMDLYINNHLNPNTFVLSLEAVFSLGIVRENKEYYNLSHSISNYIQHQRSDGTTRKMVNLVQNINLLFSSNDYVDKEAFYNFLELVDKFYENDQSELKDMCLILNDIASEIHTSGITPLLSYIKAGRLYKLMSDHTSKKNLLKYTSIMSTYIGDKTYVRRMCSYLSSGFNYQISNSKSEQDLVMNIFKYELDNDQYDKVLNKISSFSESAAYAHINFSLYNYYDRPLATETKLIFRDLSEIEGLPILSGRFLEYISMYINFKKNEVPYLQLRSDITNFVIILRKIVKGGGHEYKIGLYLIYLMSLVDVSPLMFIENVSYFKILPALSTYEVDENDLYKFEMTVLSDAVDHDGPIYLAEYDWVMRDRGVLKDFIHNFKYKPYGTGINLIDVPNYKNPHYIKYKEDRCNKDYIINEWKSKILSQLIY